MATRGFAILVTLLIAGVVSGCKRVEVKRGEKVVLVENKLENISRVALYYASKDCNQKGEIFNYCSPKEKESGCTNKDCSNVTFSFDIGKDSVSLTPLNVSDGFYVVLIIDVWSTTEKILIAVNGELPRTVIPPPQENPEANSKKGTETHGTDDLSTLGFTVGNAVGIAVGIAVGNTVGIAVGIAVGNAVGNPVGIAVGNTVGIIMGIAMGNAVSNAVSNAVGNTVGIAVGNTMSNTMGNTVGIAVGILAWCCLKKKKKKKNESAASDCKNDLKEKCLIESNIKELAEQTTGDSSEMVDRSPPVGDEDINSLDEVLIHHPSVGQENGRPGQHVHHNKSDDYDDNSKRSTTNNDSDSNFCSNFDEDDEIKSNNSNNYNDDDGVANGGDDDDGISSGDDNIKNN